MIIQVRKKLSANDLGKTGTHQAGILVPKQGSILSFFPSLDPHERNPRQRLVVRESNDGTRWEFNYIYYNNKLFGGTRNEYRLTGMTAFLRSLGAKVDDELILSKDERGSYRVSLQRASALWVQDSGSMTLRGGWKISNLA